VDPSSIVDTAIISHKNEERENEGDSMSKDELKKEIQFPRKETMVYKAFIDSCINGFIEDHSDGIVDALTTWWPESELSWERARLVAKKWLEPLSGRHVCQK
jgi:hypothetical protein